MFSVRYRIIDNLEMLGHISAEEFDKIFPSGGIAGDIEIIFGSNRVGLYREGPLCDVSGWDDVDYWINSLLGVLLCFQSGIDCVAFRLIEDAYRWLEFYRNSSGVIVNEVYEVAPIDQTHFIVGKCNYLTCNDPSEYITPYELFSATLLDTAIRFLHEIHELNPALLKTHIIASIAEKIAQLSRLQ